MSRARELDYAHRRHEPGEHRFDLLLEQLSPRRLRVRLSGEVDISAAGSLKRRLIEAIDRCGALVLDLSEVSFIDSTSLATLVVATKHAREAGTSIVVIQPLAPQPRRLFEVTDVRSLLGLSPRG